MFTPEEIKEAGLDDFRVFVHQVWCHLELKPKGKKSPMATPVQNDIARFLQHGDMRLTGAMREGSRRRQIIMGYRGVGKSFLTVAYVLWTLLLNPQAKIMVVSATEQLANDFSKFCQQLIETMPILQHLQPRVGQRTSVLAFDVGPATPDKSPSLKAVGISGQLTGSRADLIVADDIEIPKNSYSQIMREKLAIMVREFDAVLKPEGKIVYLGTPQVEASLYSALQKKGYVARIWPAEIPAKLDVYANRLGAYIVKLIEKGLPARTPTDPSRFDREDLDERLLSYGRGGYNLQFMLDTTISEADRHPLKLRDLLVADLDEKMAHMKYVWGSDPDKKWTTLDACGHDGDFYVRPHWTSPEMAQYTTTVLAVDPSGHGKDETGWAVMKNLFGYLFLMEVGGFRDGFGEATLEGLGAVAVRWGVNSIIVEENFGGGMFAKLLMPVVMRHAQTAKMAWVPRVEEVWHTGQKELRILDTLLPIVQSHRLLVDRRVIEKDIEVYTDNERYSFVYQFSRLTREKGALGNEDRLEAVSMAAAFFVERMNKDADRSVKQHQDAMEEKEIKDFIRKAKESPAKAVIFGHQAPTNKAHASNFGRRGRI